MWAMNWEWRSGIDAVRRWVLPGRSMRIVIFSCCLLIPSLVRSDGVDFSFFDQDPVFPKDAHRSIDRTISDSRNASLLPRYYISCSPFPSGLGRTFLGPSLISISSGVVPISIGWSLIVVEMRGTAEGQFIRGFLYDQNGSTSGASVFVLAAEWDCRLFNTGK